MNAVTWLYLVFAQALLNWLAGLIGKPLEERARALKVADPLLEERHKAICVTWVKKPFPDC